MNMFYEKDLSISQFSGISDDLPGYFSFHLHGSQNIWILFTLDLEINRYVLEIGFGSGLAIQFFGPIEEVSLFGTLVSEQN